MLNIHNSYQNHRFVYLILAVLLQAGCSTAPIQEMSDARQSIQAAKGLGKFIADDSDLHIAESLLQRAKLAMEEGDYGLAKKKATEARAIALSVQQGLKSGVTQE